MKLLISFAPVGPGLAEVHEFLRFDRSNSWRLCNHYDGFNF